VVIPLPKITIVDDIMAPRDTVIVRFQGKNPAAVIIMVPRLLIDTLKVSAKDVLETDVRWDAVNPEMRDFYGRWAGKRKEDRWSKTMVRVLIQGQQHAKERTGWVRIEIRGTVTTDYEYSNSIQRTFWWFYNLLFYNQQRRKYLEDAKDVIFELRTIFQRTLGIQPEEQPTW